MSDCRTFINALMLYALLSLTKLRVTSNNIVIPYMR
jgi:hypothetical protein